LVEPLVIRDLRKRLGAREVLAGIDLTLKRGDWLGFLGANGAGKSTFLRCLSGELYFQGQVLLGTQVLDGDALRAHVGYAVAPERLPEALTGAQVLRLVSAARTGSDDWFAQLDAPAQDWSRRLDLAAALDRTMATASLGMRQKIALVAACLGAPQCLLLDEALDALDPLAGAHTKQFLAEGCAARRFAVLFAAHAIEQVERWCTRVALLADGRIVQQWEPEELSRLRQGPGLESEVLHCLQQHADAQSSRAG